MRTTVNDAENIRKRAKQLLRDHQSGLITVAERLRRGLPRFADMTDAEVLRTPLALHDAQLLIARELGFASWSDLVQAPSLPAPPPLAREVSWRSYPQIFVRDIDQATEFYAQVLGFELDYRYGDPPFYAQIHRSAAVLNLRSTESSPWASDLAGGDLLAARIEVDDVKALFLEVRGNGAMFDQALRTEPWGQVTFVVRDPDRNLICFGSPMPRSAQHKE